MGREFGVDLGPSKEIESEHCSWDEVAPCVWGPVSVSAIEDGDEVCLECLNCSFSQVSSVCVCGCSLVSVQGSLL